MAQATQGYAIKKMFVTQALIDPSGSIVGFVGPNDKAVYTANDGAGSSGAMVPGSGTLALTMSAAGVNPGSTANDNVLAVLTIPANSFDGQSFPVATNREASILAAGSFGATANSKTVKIVVNPTTAVVGSAVVGGTTIATTGVVATNGGGWQMQASIIKYGAAGSNTQLAVHYGAQVGAAVAALAAPTALTLPENAAITVAITGNAAAATSDIVFNFANIEWNN
ncbi:MAG TPA: hypothetical protein VF472_12345 [Burkholderiaceae bacterium]